MVEGFQETFTLKPEEAYDEESLNEFLTKRARNHGFPSYRIIKRSLDARKKPKVHFKVSYQDHDRNDLWEPDFPKLDPSRQVVIIGCGPAGIFAAFRCLELGIKPVILDRGKDVHARRYDIAAINRRSEVNEDSNYCFGEGGAGTYSDGKLYTRSRKRGNQQKVIEILHFHGARKEILFESHPHIGTNKLPNIVISMRETIIAHGGEVHFNSRVTDLKLNSNWISGVEVNDTDVIKGESVILATGHSARDIYTLLHRKGIEIESKPFALGVRVEHPQPLIDSIQYHCGPDRGPWLPASSYSLAHNLETKFGKRGVFSFCMCPGGFIVPASTAPGEVVVNGMSPSSRNSKYANSGIVVSVLPGDYQKYSEKGPLAGMYFQSEIEKQAFGKEVGLAAPAQRLSDFIDGKVSGKLNDTSYQPGLYSAEFREILPEPFWKSLQKAFLSFNKKMKGYLSNEGQMIGIESRTSSPVRIPRDRETMQHTQVKNLFPCGEGAGYAGGIVSAAMDGLNIAEKTVLQTY